MKITEEEKDLFRACENKFLLIKHQIVYSELSRVLFEGNIILITKCVTKESFWHDIKYDFFVIEFVETSSLKSDEFIIYESCTLTRKFSDLFEVIE